LRGFGRRRDVRWGEIRGRIGVRESAYRLSDHTVDEHVEWLRCAPGEGGKEGSMLLGELLIYRYGLITKDQREEALARQKGADRGRRLGEILVGMRAIAETDLREVLEGQRSDENPWGSAL